MAKDPKCSGAHRPASTWGLVGRCLRCQLIQKRVITNQSLQHLLHLNNKANYKQANDNKLCQPVIGLFKVIFNML